MEDLKQTSDNTNYSTSKFAVTFGIPLGIMVVLLAVSMYASGMMETGEQWPIYIYYAIFPFYIAYSVYEYRKRNDGFLSMKDALKVGISVALIAGIVYGIYNLIYFYVLEPETAAKLLEVAEQKMYEQQPNMTEEQVAEAMVYVKRFSNPLFASAMYLLLSAVFGFLYGLISGAIFQKNRNPLL